MQALVRQAFAVDPRWGLVALLALCGLLYGRTLGFEFVWDDFSNVVEDRHYREPLAEGLRATTYSFRKLSDEEAAQIKPLRIRIHTVHAGETPRSLAA